MRVGILVVRIDAEGVGRELSCTRQLPGTVLHDRTAFEHNEQAGEGWLKC